MDEIWKDVVGYEGLYEVSNLGRVRSNLGHNRKKGHVLSGGNLRGYRFVILCKDGKQKSGLIHRLVARAFIGEPPTPNHTVNHKDLDKANNRDTNLEWLTQPDNVRHAAPVIPRLRGVDQPTSKLTEDQVRAIRQRYIPREVTLKQLGMEYGVSQQTVLAIIRREKWAHLS
jgi:hypothetical protein